MQRPIPEIDCFCLSENLPDTLFEPPCLKPDIFIEDRAKNRYVIVELRDSVQYRYMDLGFSLVVLCDVAGQENPTQFDLGTLSHLYVFTE